MFNIGNSEDNPNYCDVQQQFRQATFNAECSIEIKGDRTISGFTSFLQQVTYNIPLKHFIYLDSFRLTSIAQYPSVKAKKIKFGSLENCTDFGINPSVNCEVFEFDNWKQGNLILTNCSALNINSLNYIIEHALGEEDGATARTLTLHATAKANWEASEYYEADLAVLEEKGITIA